MPPTVCGEVVGHIFAQAHSPDVLLKLFRDGIADLAAPSCMGREMLSAASSSALKPSCAPPAKLRAKGSFSSEKRATGFLPTALGDKTLHLGTRTLRETPSLPLDPPGLQQASAEPSMGFPSLCRPCPSSARVPEHRPTIELDRDAPALLVIEDGIAVVVRLTHHHVHFAAIATAWEKQRTALVSPGYPWLALVPSRGLVSP